MNLSRFIASRLSVQNNESYSSFITKVASIAVAISLIVMILAVSISQGYDSSIRKKIFGFWGHIQITDSGNRLGIDSKPINIDSLFIEPIPQNEVESVNYYALKAGLIKQENELYGILLKGVSTNSDWARFQDFIVEGNVPVTKNELLISEILSNKLKLKVGDKVPMYFIDGENPIRARAPKVSGIYSTNMVELDEQIVFSTIDIIQSLNAWDSNMVEGAELFIKNPEEASEYAKLLQPTYVDYDKFVSSIEETNPDIFDWLSFLKTNQWLVLILMGIVAIVNMMSMLLVLILERSKMIGILKALGAPYSLLRNIFLQKAAQIIVTGLLLGNLIGIGLALVQSKFKIIKLDPEAYFLNHVPMDISIPSIIVLNLITIIVILASLLLPALIIRKINPIQALQFE